jgi:hypothetical protein
MVLIDRDNVFEFEVDDSEIIVGNGRVDVDHEKWCRIINESRRLAFENSRLWDLVTKEE